MTKVLYFLLFNLPQFLRPKIFNRTLKLKLIFEDKPHPVEFHPFVIHLFVVIVSIEV